MLLVRKIFITTVCVLLLLTSFVVVSADESDQTEESASNNSNPTAQQEDLEEKIAELEEKLEATQQKESSLEREIESLEGQINITEYKISSTNIAINEKLEEIELLEKDINFLENSVDRLNESIKSQESLLEDQIRQKYKLSRVTPFNMFLASNDFSNIVSKAKYYRLAQERSEELITEMRDSQRSYEQQQGIIQQKRDIVEQAKIQLENEKAEAERLKNELNGLVQQKDNLLKSTQNDEKKYQELLEAAKRELEQIQGAASVVVRTGEGVEVEKGEVIGTMGNSGFSTGAHLHFSVYRYSVEDFQAKSSWGWYYGNDIDPLEKLESKTVTWSTGCYLDPSGSHESGDGDWDWPMSSPILTQNYGSNTCYNWMYGNKPHPALDIVSNTDWSVRSVEDGEAYFCRNCLGDGGNGVFVFHDDDYMTVYWHLK